MSQIIVVTSMRVILGDPDSVRLKSAQPVEPVEPCLYWCWPVIWRHNPIPPSSQQRCSGGAWGKTCEQSPTAASVSEQWIICHSCVEFYVKSDLLWPLQAICILDPVYFITYSIES